MPKVSLALQGGGAHGAFTWGALDRILEEAEAGTFEIVALSGASAGALNATVAACALVESGPALARDRLRELWRRIAAAGALSGNAWAGYADLGPFNIDWSPGAIAIEALGLVFSPYDNPFYRDALQPLLADLLPPDRLARLNAAPSPRVFLTATNVATDLRRNFTQPEIGIDALRASTCLPAEFRAVELDGDVYWDGGYTGNPALEPLLDQADDILLVMVNPVNRTAMPPRNARAILDRLNQIMFNATVLMEANGILAINKMLKHLHDRGIDYDGPYRPINLHVVRDDAFMAKLGVVSKSSTSWPLLESLHAAGYQAADRYFAEKRDALGRPFASATQGDLTRPMMKG